MLYVSLDYGKTWQPIKSGTWMKLEPLKIAYEKAGYATKYESGLKANLHD